MAREIPINAGYAIINGTSTGLRGSDVDTWLEYQVLSQDPISNTSSLRVVLYSAATYNSSTSWNGAENFGYVGCDDQPRQWRKTAYDFSNQNVNCFGDHTYMISHSEDGTCSVSIEGAWSTNHSTYISGGSASGSAELPVIPRGARILAAPNFTDEEDPTIAYAIHSDASYSLLQACISLTGEHADIAFRDIPTTGYYTFYLTDAEKEFLRTATTGNSIRIYFVVQSRIAGGEIMKSSVSRVFTLANPNPVIRAIVRDINPDTLALTGNENVLVRYCSTAQIIIDAVPATGARIVSRTGYNAGHTLIGDGCIEKVESGSFQFNAVDSRGNSSELTLTKELIPYVKLTCEVHEAKASLENGNSAISVTVKGNCYIGSFGAADNTLAVTCEHRTMSGAHGTTPMDVSQNGNTYTAVVVIPDVDYTETIFLRAYAEDALSTVYAYEKEIKIQPVFDWGQSDFAFHVPVIIQGNPLMDYVVEYRTESAENGTWIIEKWASGKAMCYGTMSFGDVNVNIPWGTLFESIQMEQTLPYALFISPPSVIAMINQSNYAGMIEGFYGETTTSSTGAFCIYRPTEAPLHDVRIAFMASGRWK